MGLGANREMGQVSGGGCSVAAVDSTEHISVPCIKGLQEPKTQPWTSAPDPLSQCGTGTHWMILGSLGPLEPWNPGSVLLGGSWGIGGLQAKRCEEVQGEKQSAL